MVSSFNTTSGYGVNNRARAYSNTAKLDTVPNKPYTNTSPAIDSNKNALLYQLIQQLISLLQGYTKGDTALTTPKKAPPTNVETLPPPEKQKTQLEVLTPEQIALNTNPVPDVPITPEEFQLSRQQILIKFEDSVEGNQGLTEAMQERLKQFDAALNVESSFVRDAQRGWKVIQIKGKDGAGVLDMEQMDKIAQYMEDSPWVTYADVNGTAYPSTAG